MRNKHKLTNQSNQAIGFESVKLLAAFNFDPISVVAYSQFAPNDTKEEIIIAELGHLQKTKSIKN